MISLEKQISDVAEGLKDVVTKSELELSKRTGIATSNISDWKKKKTNPKADCLLFICDALEMSSIKD